MSYKKSDLNKKKNDDVEEISLQENDVSTVNSTAVSDEQAASAAFEIK